MKQAFSEIFLQIKKLGPCKHCQSYTLNPPPPFPSRRFLIKWMIIAPFHPVLWIQVCIRIIEEGWRQKPRQNVVVLEWGARSNAALRILVWSCSIVYIPSLLLGGRIYVLQQTLLCTHFHIQYSRVEWLLHGLRKFWL